MIKNFKMQVRDADVVIEPITFQPEIRINMVVCYPMDQIEHAEGSVLDDVSTYALGKRIISTMQEQLKEKRMNEGN